MVAVDAVILEVLSCNNASVRYIFKGEQVGRMSAAICGITRVSLRSPGLRLLPNRVAHSRVAIEGKPDMTQTAPSGRE
jgi:hypothetical protein